MNRCATVFLSAVAGIVGSVAVAAPAGADPGDDACPLSMVLICRLVPTAPDLEGFVDLTKEQPPPDPAAPAPDSLPPADVCARGCI